MKPTGISVLFLFVILTSFYSCQNEETVSPAEGHVSFSFAHSKPNESGKTKSDGEAVFVLLSIKDTKSQKQENIRVAVISGNQGYSTESLNLPIGNYELIQFSGLDVADNIIFKAPSKDSDLAKHVIEPLPLKFTIEKGNTSITVEVLDVSGNGEESENRLNIKLQYPSLIAFDSAFVTFKNVNAEIKIKLAMNHATYTATGHIPDLQSGDWDVSMSYFSRLREKQSVVRLLINPTATDLVLTEDSVFVKSGVSLIDMKPFKWVEFFYYSLILDGKLEGFARFPKDPLNPHFEILTFQPKWTYVYHSRSFYNRSLNGVSNFYQGGSGLELYGNKGETSDRLEQHIINTTALVSGISTVENKVWNSIDSTIIMYDYEGNELFGFFHWN